ncbi:MAG: TolC family protein [Bacteroidales bacterium]
MMKNVPASLTVALSRIFMILLATGLSTVCGAQDVRNPGAGRIWTLEECIATARVNNIQVMRQILQENAGKSDLHSARASILPNVSGWFAHNLNSGKTVNYEDYSYINTTYQDGNLGLQARLPLFEGMQGHYLIQQAKMNLRTAEQQTQALETQVTLMVVTAYLQILLSEEMVKVAEEKLKVSQHLIFQAEEFFSTGRIARSEVLTIKSQEAQDQLDLVTRQGELEMACLTMRQLLNIEGDGQIRVKTPDAVQLDQFSLPSAESIFEYARSNQPRILAAQSRVLANEASLNLARGATLPSLSLGGLVYSRYSELGVNPLDPEAIYSYQQQLFDNNYMRASVNLNIPISTRYATQTQRMISQARVNVLDSRLALEQEQKTMKEEIQQAATQARTAIARLSAAESAASSASEAYDLVKQQFEAGLVTAIDLRVSGNQLLQAETNRLQSRYELLLRSKILEVYLGREITL